MNAEPMPGTETPVPAEFAKCAHCALVIYRMSDSPWQHRVTHRAPCKDTFVKLADIRADREAGENR
jgi:hypothetical protein